MNPPAKVAGRKDENSGGSKRSHFVIPQKIEDITKEAEDNKIWMDMQLNDGFTVVKVRQFEKIHLLKMTSLFRTTNSRPVLGPSCFKHSIN